MKYSLEEIQKLRPKAEASMSKTAQRQQALAQDNRLHHTLQQLSSNSTARESGGNQSDIPMNETT